MDDLANMNLGVRIRKLRGEPILITQRELADAAGISIDVIRKLEQGTRHTTSMSTLHRIARALGVDVAVLVGQQPARSPEPDEVVMAMRQALTPVDDLLDEIMLDGEPVSLGEARRVMDYAWGLYWSGRVERLATLLPQAMAQLRATAHAARSDDRVAAHELLARGYWVTGCVLSWFGHRKAAWLAIREALRAGERGSDPLLDAIVRESAAWHLVHQGRYEESVRMTLRAASAIEPAGDVSLPHLSVYGYLLGSAASAARQGRRTDQARELLAETRAVAERIGTDRNDYETSFGPSLVVLRTVAVNVAIGNYVEALDAAKTMPRDTRLPLLARARYLTDVACAHARLGHVQRGKAALLTVEAMAPDWIRRYTLSHQTAAELVRRDRDPVLRALAIRLGVGQ